MKQAVAEKMGKEMTGTMTMGMEGMTMQTSTQTSMPMQTSIPMQTTMPMTRVNGVNVTQLFETVDTIKKTPMVAKFVFRARNQWIEGGHNRTTIGKFDGACESHTHRKTFEFDADEPPVLLGLDRGANPVEYLLTALASCVTSSIVYHAAAKGIEIQEVESRLEGDIDIRGFLGMDDTVPKGYKNIRMMFKIKADATEEELEEILRMGPTYSPVYNTITQGTKVDVMLDK